MAATQTRFKLSYELWSREKGALNNVGIENISKYRANPFAWRGQKHILVFKTPLKYRRGEIQETDKSLSDEIAEKPPNSIET